MHKARLPAGQAATTCQGLDVLHDDGPWAMDGTADGTAADNRRHAAQGARALQEYARRTGLEQDEPRTALIDLLADLHHLADALGLDYLELEDAADKRYDNELDSNI